MSEKHWDTEASKELAGAVHGGDGGRVVELLRDRPLPAELQAAGDGLLTALEQGLQEAEGHAAAVEEALRERGYDGDRELAEQLEAAAGRGPVPALRPIPVHLVMLAEVLEGDPMQGGGYLDRVTGEVLPEIALEDGGADEIEGFDAEDTNRWMYVDCEGSRDGYRDMQLFIEQLEDPEIIDRLEIAISGRGAFRRFKDVLERRPDLVDRYRVLRDERERGRARAWLAVQGYCPSSRAKR